MNITSSLSRKSEAGDVYAYCYAVPTIDSCMIMWPNLASNLRALGGGVQETPL